MTNAALNYGYGILLSVFNREIVACGYLTELGIFHSNMFNHYNLSCDLMEPFRVIIDRVVKQYEFTVFGGNEKHLLWNAINDTVYISGTKQTILNSVKIYTKSVFDALNDADPSRIKFYHL